MPWLPAHFDLCDQGWLRLQGRTEQLQPGEQPFIQPVQGIYSAIYTAHNNPEVAGLELLEELTQGSPAALARPPTHLKASHLTRAINKNQTVPVQKEDFLITVIKSG